MNGFKAFFFDKYQIFNEVVVDRYLNSSTKMLLIKSLIIWFAAFVTGVVAVIYARLFQFFETGGSWWFSKKPLLAFIIIPSLFLFASWLVKRFAPGAKGSGIPQLMAALDLANAQERKLTKYLLSARIIVIKIVSSLVMIFAGAASGREGPTLQISGSIFKIINDRIPNHWPKVSERIMYMTGGAAGLSAAFNTPLGGIVYVVEELSKIHIAKFRNYVFTGVIIAGMTAQWLAGSYLYLGYPKVASPGGIRFFAIALLVAFCGGTMAGFSMVVIKMAGKIKESFKSKKLEWLFVLILGLIVATMAVFYSHHGLGSGKEQITSLLFEADKKASVDLVLTRFMAPILAFSSGAATGIFAPSLATGAAIGGYLAQFFSLPEASFNLIVLVGMTSFLSGLTRTPFTSAILVLEMTDRHSAIFFLMLAGLIGYLGAFAIRREGLYDEQKKDLLQKIRKIEEKV
jgi:H+/Cl- antiporter ClcA